MSILESEHFRLNYSLRNPRSGDGLGPGGVGSIQLIEDYRQGLEAIYYVMTSQPWSRPELNCITEVYIQDVFHGLSSPFATEDDKGIPYIVLPCRTSEPTNEAERQWALATAIHEATHVFNYCKRPLSSPYSEKWAWFDEGLAIFMETKMIADYRDHFRFMGDWIERPELSLDDSITNYQQAGQFVAYLVKRFEIDFVNRVWTESMEGETPLEAVARLLPKGQKLISADPDERDLFASGYCLDSWFLNDPASLAYNPDLYARYGERSITESFVLRPDDQIMTSNKMGEQSEVSHLACRCYRFYIEGKVTQLCIDLSSPGEPEKFPLKAELAFVTRENRRGQVLPLRPAPHHSNGETLLTIQVENISLDEVDHFILVVTNCGMSAPRTSQGSRRTITIKALAR